jgi:tRNA(Ile)-lysidine synthase
MTQICGKLAAKTGKIIYEYMLLQRSDSERTKISRSERNGNANMNSIIQSVRDCAEAHHLFSRGGNPTVALSCGADSVALLHVLLLLREEFDFAVSACHVNHRLRGEESFRDQQFCRELCGNWQVELFLKEADVLSAKKKHQSVEEAAREVRYAFFAEISRQTGGRIACAHNSDDNTETVLINLIRGTGLAGLCGIAPVRDYIVRPLICCEKSEILAYVKENNLPYVTDSSNLSDDYTRNNLRHNVIPLLKNINPSLNAGVTRMCEQLRRDETYLKQCAAQTKEQTGGNLDAKTLAALPENLRSRIIAEVLSNNNVTPSFLRVTQCEEIILAGKGKVNLCKDMFGVVNQGIFTIQNIRQYYRNRS